MKRREFIGNATRVGGAAALVGAGVRPAHAQKVIKLTLASSHPATLPWVGFMSSVMRPEIDKRLEAALGNKVKIEWKEAFGGQLYKMNATLSSIGEGVAEIGWVFANLETAKMPLAQFATVMPFTTDDLPLMLKLANEMNEGIPALKAEWERNGVVYLGASGVDTYDLFTRFPIAKLSDLEGKKISAPGALANFLRGTGATPVGGSLTSYYTDIQTGVSDGTISIATGILPNKIYEVAPYITKVNAGAVYNGGIAVNKDVFQGLPPELQKILKDVGKEYSKALGAELMKRHQAAIQKMVEVGASQSTPVKLTVLPDAERQKWVDGLPDLAADWAKQMEGRKLPGKQIVKTWMDGLKAGGVKPARDWSKGI
ncbi:C4-dicarboxylate TRAP transporter substrate-binding protein [Burkholderiaceae bacterium FT117]|uniref:C4-dicarboxylate TRAP transporter substrate-binding protein n=1 Tax=Zeimonas sediminis TaxID=2944268 RepID=UPI0023430F62|nr:C4-dicarboxylate TRAP transporter substrate-binding protein [Zeimonas sediminis]MCM5571539.1 C4-dicarboxylate TRAP transporter substrate-binding protein [Zeimonas sediminis]